MSSDRGQASVELAAILPLLLLVVLVVAQLLAAGRCRELAGHAASAGAAALLQDEDPVDAARRTLPGWSRRRLAVEVRGRVVRVVLRPPGLLPGLSGLLRGSRAGRRRTGVVNGGGLPGERFDVAVVGRARDVVAVAAGVAGALASRSSSRAALVVGTGDRHGRAAGPSTSQARRLRERLAARDLDARASGRIVWCAIGAGALDPVAAAGRAAAVGVPVVLAVCGARAPWVEPLLDQSAIVLVAGRRGGPAERSCARGPAGPRARGGARRRARRARRAARPGRSRRPGPRGARCCPGPREPGREAARRAERGQAALLLIGGLFVIVAGGTALALIASGVTAHGARQRAADLGALATARALVDLRPRALEPRRSPRYLAPAAYLALARAVGRRTALRNGASRVEVQVAAGPLPDRATVTVSGAIRLLGGARIGGRAHAVAEVAAGAAPIGDGEYPGPFALRQGKPMRPDVALAFDRLAAAAHAAGQTLAIVSAFRTDAEQARLFAAHPDPKWVARPGTSLHRLGTELDLGPRSAYAWLAGHAGRFGFINRYSWEPWHYGFGGSPGSVSVGFGAPRGAAGSAVPAFVPERFAQALRAAAIRWGVGAALLAAQLQQESGFDPGSRSPAGALGIAQFMPGTARLYGLRDPFDPRASIDAQAHLMHDLLQRFGSVPLALAAYNAGAGRVAACRCVPPIAETQVYVQRIVALARGSGRRARPVRRCGSSATQYPLA